MEMERQIETRKMKMKMRVQFSVWQVHSMNRKPKKIQKEQSVKIFCAGVNWVSGRECACGFVGWKALCAFLGGRGRS